MEQIADLAVSGSSRRYKSIKLVAADWYRVMSERESETEREREMERVTATAAPRVMARREKRARCVLKAWSAGRPTLGRKCHRSVEKQ